MLIFVLMFGALQRFVGWTVRVASSGLVTFARVSGIWGGSRMVSPWGRSPHWGRWTFRTTGAIIVTLALASVMAGASVLAGPEVRPSVVARCDVRALSTLGGLFGNALAVNRQGIAVGIADDAHGVAQPVIWRDTVPERLTTGLANSIPLAVNAASQVIGSGVDASPSGWVWSQGRTTRLSVRDHRIARPEAINDR